MSLNNISKHLKTQIKNDEIMLEQKVRKKYYKYFNSFEIVKKELKTFYLNENISLNKKNIEITLNKYVENIKDLIKNLNEETFQREEYHKLINQQIYDINKKISKFEKVFNISLKNESEKVFYTKSNVKIIFKLHKDIIILINMYVSFKKYIYDYPLDKIKNIELNQLQKGDIILSVKSQQRIDNNIFFKIISKITHSRIGHSTIFIGLNKKNKPEYLDIRTGDATIKNLILNSESIRYMRSQRKYSNDVVGLVLRIKNELSKIEEEQIIKYLTNKLNLRYGFLKVVYALTFGKIYELLPIDKLRLKNPDQSLKTMFCSELVIRAYDSANIYLSNKSDPAETAPADLLNSPQLEVIGYINN